jgi:adenosylhomocysteine nucleosidase
MHIGVIGALAIEIALLKDQIQNSRASTKGKVNFYEGALAGKQVTIAACGVGKVCAAMGTQLMLDFFHPDWILFIGLAGALQDYLEIGDLVFAEEAVQHDVNRPASGEIIGSEIHSGRLIYRSDVSIFKQAQAIGQTLSLRSAAMFPEKKPKIHTGRILTGDRVIGREETARRLSRYLQGLCVEMEGAAAAQVCAFNDVPFFLIRCISDRANEKVEADFQKNAAYACENLTIAASELISQINF